MFCKAWAQVPLTILLRGLLVIHLYLLFLVFLWVVMSSFEVNCSALQRGSAQNVSDLLSSIDPFFSPGSGSMYTGKFLSFNATTLQSTKPSNIQSVHVGL